MAKKEIFAYFFIVIVFLFALSFMSSLAGSLRINEIMYNPNGSDNNKEYIEIYSDNYLNLSGFIIADGYSNDTLAEIKFFDSDYSLIVEEGFNHININASIYSVGATIGNNLNNDGDNLILFYPNGSIADAVNYSDNASEGYSLEWFNGSWYQSFVFNGTPGSENSVYDCVPEWTEVINEICNDEDYYTGWFNDTNRCYLITNWSEDLDGKPGDNRYNNTCDYDGNGIIGSLGLTDTSGISVLELSINESTDLSQDFSGVQNVKFDAESKTLLEFDFNFSSIRLNLANITLKKQSVEEYGFVVIKGLNLTSQNQTKTIYIDRILNGTGICVKDAEISSVTEITSDSKGDDEYCLSCPGINENYSCNLINNNTQYKITGLSHSGAKEQETYCGDGIANSNETCSSCPADAGLCSPVNPEAKRFATQAKSIPKSDYQESAETDEISVNQDEESEESELQISKNTDGNKENSFSFAGITGAFIGSANKSKISA